jgi:hypothetical protein
MARREGKRPFRSPFLRLAYTIGVNVFGLVLGLSFVIASLLHLDMAWPPLPPSDVAQLKAAEGRVLRVLNVILDRLLK